MKYIYICSMRCNTTSFPAGSDKIFTHFETNLTVVDLITGRWDNAYEINR